MSEAQAASGAPHRRRFWYGLALAAVLLAVFVVHLWVISAGKMWPKHWPKCGDYYAALGDAFGQAQTHLLVTPDPALLALPDPYDPEANLHLRVHDALLFDGKYYFYWGPVPAILITPLRVVVPGKPITDAYLLFAFTTALMVASALLMLRVRSQFFPDGSRYVTLLMTAAAGLAMPLPFLLARPAIYEASIVAGQFFLLAGLYFAFTAFAARDDALAPSPLRLMLTGVAWALAVGSRLSLAVAVVLLAVLVAWRIVRRDGVKAWSGGQALKGLLALGLPLATGAFLLGLYNYARFGSWHESGVRYQLAGVPLVKIGPGLFSRENVPPNMYSYALRPWMRMPDFPGIQAQDTVTSIPSWIPCPPYYYTEPITGIVWTTPLFLLLGMPVFHLARSGFRAIVKPRVTTGAAPAPEPPASTGLNWLVTCLLAASAAGFAPVLMLIGSSMRYFADLTPSLFVVAAIGLWQLERSAGRTWPWRGRIVLFLSTLLVLYCVAVALLLAFTGYADLFRRYNPGLTERLARWCGW